MMLLVIDTSTERMLVGVRATERTHQDRWINIDSQGNHARDVLDAVARLTEGSRPKAIGVVLGPGSFTGVRIGLATAKGLAEGWGIPLIGLDNLKAMADAWYRLYPTSQAPTFTVIDARKQKFYGALYRQAKLLIEPADRSPEEWLRAITTAAASPVAVTGYQASLFAERLQSIPPGWTVLNVLDWCPGLLDQAEEGWKRQEFLPPEAGPRYLRLSEAEENLLARST